LASTSFIFIIHCIIGPGQTKEEEFYGNTTHSADFEEFLNFLGDRVELTGWKGFRAGLDVRTGTTGSHSVFTKFQDLSIMFHVSTFLPYNPRDAQQVCRSLFVTHKIYQRGFQIERKRHLGNDIVMILFQEGDLPFTPDAITSEFNRMFISERCIINLTLHRDFLCR
jgi:RAP1 GTPase activating protein 1